MPRSFAQSTDLTCPHCGHTFSAEVWLIIDAGERPDLLARTRAGELHDVPCPHCGDSGTVDAPLLIYLPDPAQGQPPLIFSPAQQSSREQTQQQGGALLGILADALGPAWQDAWWEQISTVPRALLSVALSDDPAAAIVLAATLIAADDQAAKRMEASGAASPLARILPFTDPPNFT